MHTCFPAVAVLAIATLQVLVEIASPRGGTIAQELPPSSAESGAPATALNRRLDIEFKETRLVDAIDYLQQQTGVTFYLRAKKLEEQGVNVDTPITSQFRAIRLESWLDLALDDLDLTWMVKDDLIVITTREDEERQLVTRVYDCRDLLAIPQISDPAADPVTPGSDKEAAAADKAAPNTSSPAVIGCGSVRRTPQRPADPAEHLMEVITQAVDLATWDENGGPGTIGEYRGMLVVTQTDRIHAKIANVLNMMRQSAGLEASKTGQVVR